MKLIGGFGLMLAASAAAQTDEPPFNYPAIPKTVTTAQGFVAPNWVIVSKAEGDLNRDGRSDIVMALWPEPFAKAEEWEKQRDGPFYRLIIAFAQPSGGYRLVADNTTLIMQPSYSGGYEDPLADGDLNIVRGSLDISRQMLRGHFRYRFRWTNGAFRLIGWEYGGSDGHCVTTTSINYLTRRAHVEVEALSEEGGGSKARLSTKPGSLVTLEEAGSEGFYPEQLLVGDWPDCP